MGRYFLARGVYAAFLLLT